MQLSPALRQRLGRARLVAPGVLAAGGVGEWPSAQRGEGIEFEQHRPYQPGDDARRIDPNLYARWGAPFVREYNVGQQLTVTLLIDASRSMEPGAPAKLEIARSIATGLAFVGDDLYAVARGLRLVRRGRFGGERARTGTRAAR